MNNKHKINFNLDALLFLQFKENIKLSNYQTMTQFLYEKVKIFNREIELEQNYRKVRV